MKALMPMGGCFHTALFIEDSFREPSIARLGAIQRANERVMASRKRVRSRPVRAQPLAATRFPEAEPIRDPWIGIRIAPLRVFLGVTFLYAGLVKLLDPSFLDPTAPTSLVVQLQGFARDSPLAPLITLIGIPLATPIGVLIALSEVAVGLGALTGLAGRAAAIAGCAIALLFWLTASWPVKPYFYGPDLPYAAGWLTLALIGDGRWYVLSWRSIASLFGSSRRGMPDEAESWSPERRTAIEAIAIGAASVVIAGLALQRPRWLRDVLVGPSAPGAGPAVGGAATETPSAGYGTTTAGATETSPSAAAPTAVAGARGPVIGKVRSVDAAGSSSFTVPGTGDPGVIVKLADGSFVAFDATCTHAGCPVQYVPQDQALECPCHGAAFDPAHHGAVLGGPTNVPLTELPITVDHASGVIRLTA
jgi:thiosulfate dehydrogenase (quinone) large subunit